jgi:hypothetical protein
MEARQRIATECRTIVLTASDPAIHAGPIIETALGSLGSTVGGERRHALLTADLSRLVEADDPDTIGLVADDIKTAAALHGSRRLVVATRGNPRELLDRLRSHPTISSLDLIVNGVNLNQFTSEHGGPTAAIVSCMDWRQHGVGGGLIAAAVRSYGPAAYAVLATAGGGRDLVEASPRSNAIVSQLRSMKTLKRVILTAPADASTSLRDLSLRLHKALRLFHDRLGHREIVTAIAMIEDGRVARLRSAIEHPFR